MVSPKQGWILFLWITWFLYDCNGCCQTKAIRKPFISSWYGMAVNGTSPLVILHSLNEIPVKVDVQVKVVIEGKDYIFPGLGSAQRDDDIPTEYGGVAYAYNATHVLLYVPVYEGGHPSGGIGRVITTDQYNFVLLGGTSYNGPFVESMTSCKVRVRAWRLSDWPKPDFSVEKDLKISTLNPYRKVQHRLEAYPDFVTVQLYSPEGLVFEGLGTTSITVDHVQFYRPTHICGTVFGIDDTSITLWAASKYRDCVSCVTDGWGNFSKRVKSADVVIHAWALKQSDILHESKFRFVQGDPLSGKTPVGDAFDLDFHFVNVEVKDMTISQGKVFYGAGSASLGNPGEPFGGVVFGYTQSEVFLWTPSPNVNGSNMIYIGGVWGNGTENMEINQVEITVRIVIAGFSECEVPPEIPNAEMMYDGIINGSRTLYSCFPGFSSNGGQVMTVCNGTMWSTTNLTCTTGTPKYTNQSLEEFQSIVDGLKVGKNNTSAYRRRLTCASDPRKSSKAIGSLGAFLISGVIGLIVLADCLTIMKRL